tara:strand:+ start:460 stop:567 length:108 start_codon:yes stop_codon:yes gene_type:complete
MAYIDTYHTKKNVGIKFKWKINKYPNQKGRDYLDI